jgi:hypothetical protein
MLAKVSIQSIGRASQVLRLASCLKIGSEQLNLGEARTGSASQQLSQLAGSGSLSPCFVFWLLGVVLASFQSTSALFTSGFLPHFLVGFAPLFIPEKIGLR